MAGFSSTNGTQGLRKLRKCGLKTWLNQPKMANASVGWCLNMATSRGKWWITGITIKVWVTLGSTSSSVAEISDVNVQRTVETMTYIWVNYNISLTWNKAMLLGMISLTNHYSQWGRSEVVMKFTQINHHKLYIIMDRLSMIIIKGSLGGETSVLRTFRMSGKELVKERVSQRNS